jgi:hypothetical protein
MSAYDDIAPKLMERGYFPLPIGPGTKKPQRLVGSGYCDLAGWADPDARPETSPQPGAGVGLRLGKQPDGTFVVALDWDNDDAFLAAMDSRVWSPIQKVGKRGGTTLYRSAREIPSRDFKINGKIAVQVLAQGKQTVLPPTIHPETGKPYTYGDERATLDTCRASELSLLPDDYVEHIESILRPLGLDQPEPESKPEVKANGHDDSDDTFRDLNNKALHSLALWVPDLGLQRCKRRRGPHASYDAVAEWRPGTLPLDQRPFNLSIYPSGIKDFGTNEGYTPIDLVMAARKCEFGTAVDWLRERVLPKVEVNWDALAGNGSARAEKGGDGPDTDNTAEEDEPKGAQPAGAILRLDRWLARDLPEPDFLLGSWLTTTSRVLLFAPTGIGKSMLAVAIGFRSAEGKPFMHWIARRKAMVLYIDAEMARRLLQERLADEVERSGMQPEGFHAFSHEDENNFSPLNTPLGQRMVENLIKQIGQVDLIIFDNIMSLILGDMKDEESWRKTLPWVKSLTKRHIGQIWIHHTGHDESHSYGTKTREWQMDTVIALEKVKRFDTDVSFQMVFGKARERRPETRGDFADMRVALLDGEWTFETVSAPDRAIAPSPLGKKFLSALVDALNGADTIVHKKGRCVNIDTWRRLCVLHGLLDKGQREDSARSLFSKYKRELIACNLVTCRNELVWLVLAPAPRG